MTQPTKQALLEAAREVFATQGFKGATVRSIASAANANIAAVGYHFGSKKALYHAVLEAVTRPVRERITVPIDPTISALEQLERYIRLIFQFVAANPDIPQFIVQQLVSERPLPPPGKEMIRLNLNRAVELISLGQEQGLIRPAEPKHLAMTVVGQPILLGIYRPVLIEATGFDPHDTSIREQITDDIVTLVIAGLATEKGTTR